MMKVKLSEVVGRDSIPASAVKNEKGAIGYILAWLLGVPIGILAIVWAFNHLF